MKRVHTETILHRPSNPKILLKRSISVSQIQNIKQNLQNNTRRLLSSKSLIRQPFQRGDSRVTNVAVSAQSDFPLEPDDLPQLSLTVKWPQKDSPTPDFIYPTNFIKITPLQERENETNIKNPDLLEQKPGDSIFKKIIDPNLNFLSFQGRENEVIFKNLKSETTKEISCIMSPLQRRPLQIINENSPMRDVYLTFACSACHAKINEAELLTLQNVYFCPPCYAEIIRIARSKGVLHKILI